MCYYKIGDDYNASLKPFDINCMPRIKLPSMHFEDFLNETHTAKWMNISITAEKVDIINQASCIPNSTTLGIGTGHCNGTAPFLYQEYQYEEFEANK